MKCDTSPGRVRYAALLCAVTATIYWFVSSTEDGAGFVNMLPRQQMTKLDTCAARSSAARFFVDNVACECGDIDNDGLFPNMTGLVRPPTPGSRTLTGWIPDLHAAATSQSFPELRMHLSGRPTASIGGISELIDSYAQLHRRIMSGELPANFLAVSGRDGAGTQKGKGFSLGGIGDRIKGWRMAFYLAILSKRALLLEDWQSFPLESVFEPYRVNWTVPDAMRQKLSVRECLKLGNMVPATDDAVTVASLAARAFTGEALECIVTNVFPDTTGDFWLPYVCPDLQAMAPEIAPNGDYDPCRAWHNLFQRPAQEGLAGPMLDALFKPSRAFLHRWLLPWLRRHEAWTCPGPRIALHVRTFAVDGDRRKTMLDVFRTCVRCSVWRAANTALLEATGGLATPSVFLVSDDKSTLVGTVGDSDSDLFPTNMVSSPLQLADNVPSVNIDNLVAISQRNNMTADEVVRGVMSVFNELIALSACDALAASDSGFSGAAASWGGIPAENIRILPRFVATGTDASFDRCPDTTFVRDFYVHNRL